MNNQLLEQGVLEQGDLEQGDLEQGNLFTHKESEVVSGYLYTLIGKDNYTFNLYSDHYFSYGHRIYPNKRTLYSKGFRP
jgi:hypothetical protein